MKKVLFLIVATLLFTQGALACGMASSTTLFGDTNPTVATSSQSSGTRK